MEQSAGYVVVMAQIRSITSSLWFKVAAMI
jgi:hypothetical protein